MRKLVNSTFITLDGVIENPQNWPAGDVEDDSVGTVQLDLLASCDTIVMGRHTYEIFAPAWSARSGDPYTDRMNSIAKIVGSSTLKDPSWNNTKATPDVVAEVRRRKQEPGGDLIQFGFGEVTHALIDNCLLDELQLWVHPVMVGGSTEDLLFRKGLQAAMNPVGATVFKTGVVRLVYRLGGSTNPC